MENNKKQQNFSRTSSSKTFQTSDLNRKNNIDIQQNKPWPRNTKQREQNQTINNEQQRNSKQYTTFKTRPYADKRPRPRGDGNNSNINNTNSNKANNGFTSVNDDISITGAGLATEETVYSASTGAVPRNAKLKHELSSVYSPGSKKQNLNHLLNFHCTPHESDYSLGLNVFGRAGNSNGGNAGNLQRQNQTGKKHKYNKEQFLQANFQFVIKTCAKPSMSASPDTLIDWCAIEQIIIQTSEEPQCPICLYPPIAAKLTRCGHVYCWPCILHYLALSDKKWRKCPICYEAIHINDLKSTLILQQRAINVNNEITFHLMRRKKNSMFVEKFKTIGNGVVMAEECFPTVSGNDEAKLFSKFLIANKIDILNIMEREHRELTIDDDETCPEFVFIQQALDLLKERREILGNIDDVETITSNVEKLKDKDKKNEEQLAGLKIFEQNSKQNVNVNNEALEINEKINATNEEAEELEEKLNVEVEVGAVAKTISNDLIGDIAAATSLISTKYYYFYQSDDGQNIYLHPLNIKMLQACYGTLEQAPRTITARILQKEQHSMNEEQRRKFTCLSHLPLTCQFSVVEVDLQPPIVTGGILKLFKEDVLQRKKERQRREREERKREKQINEINERQMGKLIASTANLNLSSAHEFPTCGFEESLIGIEAEQEALAAAAATSSPKTTKTISYSAVIVDGTNKKTKKELWPTLSSPSSNRTVHQNMYHELSNWGNNKMANTTDRSAASDRSSECESMTSAHELDSGDDAYNWLPATTNFGDVLKEALSHKKQNNNNSNNKNNNNNNNNNNAAIATGINAGSAAASITSGTNSVLSVGTGGAGGGGGVAVITANKKNKKAKKMLPLFSTGMNYNGN